MQVWVISYHYPPSTAAGGSRAHSFVRYLTHQQEILSGEVGVAACVGAPGIATTKSNADDGKPHGYELLRIPFGRSPSSGSAEKGSGQRGNLTRLSQCRAWTKSIAKSIMAPWLDMQNYPDRYHGWSKSVFQALDDRFSKTKGPVVLVSSGPPHSTHLAARRLKKAHGFGWVLDMRDPWISNPFRHGFSYPAEYLDRLAERHCLSDADAIVVNTVPALELLRERFGEMVHGKAYCVPNGFDEGEFVDLTPRRLWKPCVKPVMLYAGSLYGPRSGGGVLDALRRLRKQGGEVPRLVLLGAQDQNAERELVERMGGAELEDDVEILPSVDKKMALGAMMAADALVLIGDSRPDQLQVPSKLFEYLRIGKPIVALYPMNSPVIGYLKDYAPAFWQAQPDNPSEISSAITSMVQSLKEHRSHQMPSRSINELSREYQNSKLWAIVKNVMIKTKAD